MRVISKHWKRPFRWLSGQRCLLAAWEPELDLFNSLRWKTRRDYSKLRRFELNPRCSTQDTGLPLQWNLSDRAGKSAIWIEKRSGVYSLRYHPERGSSRLQKGVAMGVTSWARIHWSQIRALGTRWRLRGEIRRVCRVPGRRTVRGVACSPTKPTVSGCFEPPRWRWLWAPGYPLRPEPGARL